MTESAMKRVVWMVTRDNFEWVLIFTFAGLRNIGFNLSNGPDQGAVDFFWNLKIYFKIKRKFLEE